MDSYTITIAPNDDSGSTTRLVVDSSDGQVRITDVHLHAAEGLSSGHIPSVDFGLLLLAVTGGGQSSGTAGSPPTAVAAVGSDGAAVREIESSAPDAEESGAEEPDAEEPDAGPVQVPAATRRRRSAKAAPAATAPVRKAPVRKAPARKAPVQKAAVQKPPVQKAPARKAPVQGASVQRAAAKKGAPVKKATPVKKASANSGRVYRRTPDDLAAVFERTGTVAAVADHYQVPRYTAQGWIGRLRADR
jgi:type IV secretory pathway VirB10-like protein